MAPLICYPHPASASVTSHSLANEVARFRVVLFIDSSYYLSTLGSYFEDDPVIKISSLSLSDSSQNEIMPSMEVIFALHFNVINGRKIKFTIRIRGAAKYLKNEKSFVSPSITIFVIFHRFRVKLMALAVSYRGLKQYSPHYPSFVPL